MIKITRKQSEALYEFYSLTGEKLKNQLAFLTRDHGKFVGVYEPLNEVPFDEFAELLVTEQYDVKRTIEEVLNDFIDDSKEDIWDIGAECLLDLKRELQLEGLI
ncbi:hypothetical protein [Bacillus phage phiAGATE]|uniref:Uncharacterized protein n=1 Tax=Bacillus phage phiAGATE TaxID=1204533 RepID=L0LCC4_9CAUD|nr:hypothetical protein G380_gp111 [Bacillus phage phiAGATE]AGB62761.1 hypothetical protein [Bacillus phage phiAGATE]